MECRRHVEPAKTICLATFLAILIVIPVPCSFAADNVDAMNVGRSISTENFIHAAPKVWTRDKIGKVSGFFRQTNFKTKAIDFVNQLPDFTVRDMIASQVQEIANLAEITNQTVGDKFNAYLDKVHETVSSKKFSSGIVASIANSFESFSSPIFDQFAQVNNYFAGGPSHFIPSELRNSSSNMRNFSGRVWPTRTTSATPTNNATWRHASKNESKAATNALPAGLPSGASQRQPVVSTGGGYFAPSAGGQSNQQTGVKVSTPIPAQTNVQMNAPAETRTDPQAAASANIMRQNQSDANNMNASSNISPNDSIATQQQQQGIDQRAMNKTPPLDNGGDGSAAVNEIKPSITKDLPTAPGSVVDPDGQLNAGGNLADQAIGTDKMDKESADIASRTADAQANLPDSKGDMSVKYGPDGHRMGASAIDENGVGHFADDDDWHPWIRPGVTSGQESLDRNPEQPLNSISDADEFSGLDAAAATLQQQQASAMQSFEENSGRDTLTFQLNASTSGVRANMQNINQMAGQAFRNANATLMTGVAAGATIMATQVVQQQQRKAAERRRREQMEARAAAASSSSSQNVGLSGQTRKVNYHGMMLDVPVEFNLHQNGMVTYRR